ncbi:unnamed protein product [Didymodactylos carnosus]|uniref:Uncharacterized protein n=2 Tax=Didymodactylos carnosus TaxID=1234261 RepID=A0A814JX11_9BILA|nr:unnamed protein product [Didymodactylos carnosus]CAF3814780.1 unnamed protein product [Didymodactylos carnosus]
MINRLKNSDNELITQLSSQNGLYTLIYIIELEKTQKSIVNVYQRIDDSWTKFDGRETSSVSNVECNGKVLTLWLCQSPVQWSSSTSFSKTNEVSQQTVPSVSTIIFPPSIQRPEDDVEKLSLLSPSPSLGSSLNVVATNNSSVFVYNSIETPISTIDETITDLSPISNTDTVSPMAIEKPNEATSDAQNTYQGSSTITFDNYLLLPNNESSFLYNIPMDPKTNDQDEFDKIDDSFWDSIEVNHSSITDISTDKLTNVEYPSSIINSDTTVTSSTRSNQPTSTSTASTISKTDSVSDLFLTLFDQTKQEHQTKYSITNQRVDHDIAVDTLASNVLWPLLVSQTKRKLKNSKTTRTSSISGLSDSQRSFASNTFSTLTHPILTSSSSTASRSGSSNMNLEKLKQFLNYTEPTARTKTSLNTTTPRNRRVTPYSTNKK